MKNKIGIFVYNLLSKFLNLMPTPQSRVFFLRLFGARIAKDCLIHEVLFQNLGQNGFRNLIMESKATIQSGCILDLAEKIILREKATVSAGVMIATHRNPGLRLGKPLAKVYPPQYGKVEIGYGGWVGVGAIILHGVRIGRLSVVAAGSVVMEDVPERTVVAGIPAKVKKHLDV
ncbi:acyltransferase [Thermodesulfobacteriota bacterium]